MTADEIDDERALLFLDLRRAIDGPLPLSQFIETLQGLAAEFGPDPDVVLDIDHGYYNEGATLVFQLERNETDQEVIDRIAREAVEEEQRAREDAVLLEQHERQLLERLKRKYQC